MSVGVCFYVDHDLPTDSAESTVIRSDDCFKVPDEFVFTGSFDDSFFLLDL